MHHSRKPLMNLGLALAAGCFALSAEASSYQFSFAGTVSANNPIVGSPAIGDPVNGSFTIDIAQTAGVGPNCAGSPDCWSDTATKWTLNGALVDTSTVYYAPSFGIWITTIDSAPGAGADVYDVVLGGLDLLTSVELKLTNAAGTAFEGLANPLLASMANFDGGTLQYTPLCVTGISCALNPVYTAQITSFSAQPVPLPAGVLLFAPALVTALRATRRSASTS